MRRKVLSFICVAAIICLQATSASARGSIRLSGGIDWSLGSLIADGALSGLGNTDVLVKLDASGYPVVTCTNLGGNQAPGQNPPKVSASGNTSVDGKDAVSKNGKSPFGVETIDPTSFSSGTEGGCPNNNWTARIDFIYWTNATISVYDKTTSALLLKQDYTCTTTRASVSCMDVP
jgi:hypothetical protein